MQNGFIPNSAITASFWHVHDPATARLFYATSSWYSTNLAKNNFLLIDLGLVKTVVTRIATQGWCGGWHSVLEYHLSFSREGIFWFRYTEHSQEKVILMSQNRHYSPTRTCTCKTIFGFFARGHQYTFFMHSLMKIYIE
jgi:hypothetical protein